MRIALSVAVAVVLLLLWQAPAEAGRAAKQAAAAVGREWRWGLTVALGAALAAVWLGPLALRAARRPVPSRWRVPIAITSVLGLGFLTFLWVFHSSSEPASGSRVGPSRSSLAVQSGALVAGLAGGAITVWLNDQRRRHDDEDLAHRREQSTAELAQDRERAEEDRFAKAVELLGHSNASVRVGAMHALAGLARSAEHRTQTIVDVLCAYLRQPFLHYSWDSQPPAVDPAESDYIASLPPEVRASASRELAQKRVAAEREEAKERAEQDREREVRRTALRLVTAMLPRQAPAEGQPPIAVDLTSAHLDDVSFRDLHLQARWAGAHFHGVASLVGAHFHANADLDRAHFHVDASLDGAHFHANAYLDRAHFHADAYLDRAHFHVDASLDGAHFHGVASLVRARFHGDARLDRAHFHANAYLDRAHFHGDASRDGAHFHGVASLDGAHFHGDASLDGAHFHANAYLDRAHFHGGASLDEAHFHGDAWLDGAQFHRVASVDGAQFHGDASLDGAHFHGAASLAAASWAHLSVAGADFCGVVSFPPSLKEAKGATVNARVAVALPDGWRLRTPGGTSELVAPAAPDDDDNHDR
ncbi:pentapeptide repeat-containing protein [Motilibacter aurantiacus]|uniref:pentapeptide repeat-containing protein n=1 Tax=Motilibacter aurantiacus TaxID=2714955 RepID=UPI00140CA235|nr:hypothetical protein [Motilibacter aurantiacus]